MTFGSVVSVRSKAVDMVDRCFFRWSLLLDQQNGTGKRD